MYEFSRSYSTCHISGFAHHDAIEVLPELKIGTRLTLEVEPDNPYDPRAVVIKLGDTKLGYIPRDKNYDISMVLFFGHEVFEVFINQIDFEQHPQRQIGIAIRLKDNRL